MVSKYLENTKPINLILGFTALFIGHLLYQLLIFNRGWGLYHWLEALGVWIFLLLSMYFLNTIVRWNELTEKPNSYAIFFFAVFLMLFPQTFEKTLLVLSNLLIIIALWRILSLKTNKNISQKIFDASFLIIIAGMLHFWAFIFLLNIWISLLFYGSKKKLYWFIPLSAMFCIVVLFSAILIVLGKPFPVPDFDSLWTFDYSYAIAFPMSVSLIITSIMFLISLVVYLFKTKYHSLSSQVIIQFLIVGLIAVFLSKESIFIFAPLSILFALYVEKIERNWLKNTILWFLLLLPLVMLLLYFFTESQISGVAQTRHNISFIV